MSWVTGGINGVVLGGFRVLLELAFGILGVFWSVLVVLFGILGVFVSIACLSLCLIYFCVPLCTTLPHKVSVSTF